MSCWEDGSLVGAAAKAIRLQVADLAELAPIVGVDAQLATVNDDGDGKEALYVSNGTAVGGAVGGWTKIADVDAAGGVTLSAIAAALGIRTHPSGTFAFFIHTDTGDDNADGLTLGTAWKTAPRCFESHRYARILLGEERQIVFNVAGLVASFDITVADWHEASNVKFMGSDEIEVLPSTATVSSTYTTDFDGFLRLSVAGTPFVPGTLEDGTFVVDVAGTQEPRAVMEASLNNEVVYTGHNSNSIVQVVTSPNPVRLYRQATTVNITGFSSSDRALWDAVRFEKLDLGPDGEGFRPTNGSVHFIECSVRLNYSQEADLANFTRCWFKPQSFINLGRMSIIGGVIDGRGSTMNLTRSRKDLQFKNAVGIYKPDAINHEGNTSVTRGGTAVHLHFIDAVKITPSAGRIGPGGVLPLDHIIMTGMMKAGAGTTIIDGGGELVGGWNALSDIRQEDGLTPALVVGMNRGTEKLPVSVLGDLSVLVLPAPGLGSEVCSVADAYTLFQAFREVPETSGTTTVQLEFNGVPIPGAVLSWTAADDAFAVKSVVISPPKVAVQGSKFSLLVSSVGTAAETVVGKVS